jgi:hypothetical protein
MNRRQLDRPYREPAPKCSGIAGYTFLQALHGPSRDVTADYRRRLAIRAPSVEGRRKAVVLLGHDEALDLSNR